jgi:glycosyltransferase involved in cell wall biosynthesis
MKQKSPKILLIDLTSSGWGGGQEYLLTLLSGLQRENSSTTLLVKKDSLANAKYREKFEELNLNFEIFSFKESFLNLIKLVFLLATYDVIHFHRLHEIWIAWLCRILFPLKKLILSNHIPLKKFVFSLFLFDFVTGNSSFVVKSIRKNSFRKKVELIYPCVESSHLLNIEPEKLIGTPVLLMGGNLYKNQQELVDIFKLILSRLPESMLYFSHPNSSEGKDAVLLQRKIDDEDLSERVKVLSDVDRTRYLKLLKSCDVFVYTYTKEPFGLVLLEAALLNKRIVAYKFEDGGGNEVLESAETAVLIEPHNQKDFAEQVILSADQKTLDTQLNSELVDKFSVTGFIAKHLLIYGT